MRKINIGVIGVGYCGKKTVHDVKLGKQNSLVDLRAVCDLLEDNLKYCENYAIPNIAKCARSLMEVLD